MKDNLVSLCSRKKSSLRLCPHTGLVPEILLFDLFLLFHTRKGQQFVSLQGKFAMASSSLSSSIHCASARGWFVPKLTKAPLQEKILSCDQFPSLPTSHTVPMPAQKSRCSLRSDYSELKRSWFIYPPKKSVLYCSSLSIKCALNFTDTC